MAEAQEVFPVPLLVACAVSAQRALSAARHHESLCVLAFDTRDRAKRQRARRAEETAEQIRHPTSPPDSPVNSPPTSPPTSPTSSDPLSDVPLTQAQARKEADGDQLSLKELRAVREMVPLLGRQVGDACNEVGKASPEPELKTRIPTLPDNEVLPSFEPEP